MVFPNLCRFSSRSSLAKNAMSVWMNSRSFLATQASMRNPWLVKGIARSHNKSDPGHRRLFSVETIKKREFENNLTEKKETQENGKKSGSQDHSSRWGYGRHDRLLIGVAMFCSAAFVTHTNCLNPRGRIKRSIYEEFVLVPLKHGNVDRIIVSDSIAFVHVYQPWRMAYLHMIDIESPESFRDKLEEAKETLGLPYLPCGVTYLPVNKELEEAQIASWKKAPKQGWFGCLWGARAEAKSEASKK